MNLHQIRCALEVSRVGSITRAAENLYISQPNLSRTIKELEQELGVRLFHRSTQGMRPTLQAAQFFRYAQNILQQMDELQELYQPHEESQRLLVAGVQSGYLNRAFASFANRLEQLPAELSYQQMESGRVLEEISKGYVQIGLVRYPCRYEEHFREQFAKAGVASRTLVRFHPHLLMAQEHPLAGEKVIQLEQLSGYRCLMMQESAIHRGQEGQKPAGRPIQLADRTSVYEALKIIQGSYTWSFPVTEAECRRHGLVQCSCPQAEIHRDVALWQAKHGLSSLARTALVALQQAASRQGFSTGML